MADTQVLHQTLNKFGHGCVKALKRRIAKDWRNPSTECHSAIAFFPLRKFQKDELCRKCAPKWRNSIAYRGVKSNRKKQKLLQRTLSVKSPFLTHACTQAPDDSIRDRKFALWRARTGKDINISAEISRDDEEDGGGGVTLWVMDAFAFCKLHIKTLL